LPRTNPRVSRLLPRLAYQLLPAVIVTIVGVLLLGSLAKTPDVAPETKPVETAINGEAIFKATPRETAEVKANDQDTKPAKAPAPRPAATLADGLTPPFVGALPLAVAQEALDEVLLITEDEIQESMRALLVRAKLYVEGSGAAATAALLAGKVKLPAGARVVSIVSGGNVDPERVLALFSPAGAAVRA